MPTIRDAVQALGERTGVDAVLVLGRDGLPIDSLCPNGINSDNLAALVPPVVNACDQLAEVGHRGQFGSGVVECDAGYIIVTTLASEAYLAVLVSPGTNVGTLLWELRQYQSAIAGLL